MWVLGKPIKCFDARASSRTRALYVHSLLIQLSVLLTHTRRLDVWLPFLSCARMFASAELLAERDTMLCVHLGVCFSLPPFEMRCH